MLSTSSDVIAKFQENIKLLNKVTCKSGGGNFQESILLQSYGFTLALVDK